MRYNSLHYFSVLAQEQHYSVAAARLGISQPSLSSAIHNLENDLGVKLFEKDGRNIRLTEKGHFFREKVDAALKELNDASAALQSNGITAPIVIRFGLISGAIPGTVAREIVKYARENPRVRFQMTEASSSELLELIRRDKLDMAIVDTFDRDRNLHFRKLLEADCFIAMPTSHPLASRDVLEAKDIAHLPQIVTDYDVNSSFSRWANGHPENASILCAANTTQTALELVAAGLGLACVVEGSMQARDDLTYVRLANRHSALYMCSLYNKWLEPVVWEFVEKVTKTVREESHRKNTELLGK